MPLLRKPPAGFPLILEPEAERLALTELADELAGSWIKEIEEAFPEGATGLTFPLKPMERLARYLNVTEAGDATLLALPDYAKLAREGLLDLPQSEYWRRLVLELPRDAERTIKDFLDLSSSSRVSFAEELNADRLDNSRAGRETAFPENPQAVT